MNQTLVSTPHRRSTADSLETNPIIHLQIKKATKIIPYKWFIRPVKAQP